MIVTGELAMLMRVAEQVGISYRQADYWVRAGYVRVCDSQGNPTNGPGSGRGRYLLDTEAFVLERMARLVGAGLTPETASTVARRAVVGRCYRIGDGVHIVLSGPGT